MQSSKKPLNWTNIIFFTVLPIIACGGTYWLCTTKSIPMATWIFAGIMMMATGLAITAGYHRLFSHKSYQAVWPIRLVLLLFASAAFQGSALEWCCDHRNHHRYTDTDQDPYSIKKGFWFAHIGWLFHRGNKDYDFSNVPDLLDDKLIMLQHNYYLPIAAFMGVIFPLGLAAFWGDPLGGFIIAGVLRMTLNHHFTFAINSVAHMFGNRTYSDNQTARDNWIVALATYGEGYHNFHHQFPLDYRNGIRAYHYDPTKWFIKFLSWFRLTYDLKQVSMHRILRYRVRMEEEQFIDKLKQLKETQLMQLKKLMQPTLDNIYDILKRMDALEKEFIAIRKEQCKMNYQKQLKAYKLQFKTAQQNLKNHLHAWRDFLKNSQQMITD